MQGNGTLNQITCFRVVTSQTKGSVLLLWE